MSRSLNLIAREIRQDWKKVNYAAVPYLRALSELDGVGDAYGYDTGRSVVLYFLANAGTWRGPVAKAIKVELKGML